MSINMVTISGNLTKDSTLRTTAGGFSILSGCVAVNERRKNAAGEWEDHPNFIDFSIFGKRAEALEQHLKKGTKVCIQGKLRQSAWERDGQKRSKIEVIAEEIEFSKKTQAQKPQYVESFYYDEDIPFD